MTGSTQMRNVLRESGVRAGAGLWRALRELSRRQRLDPALSSVGRGAGVGPRRPTRRLSLRARSSLIRQRCVVHDEASCSAVAASLWPPATASMSAVLPSVAAAFTSIPGAASSAVTVSLWPLSAASMSAVPPRPPAAFTPIPGAASSAATVSVWPPLAASMSAV
eukprot:scaffold93926_cov60-Phaeocystis_antarctica.AAC.1